MLDDEHADLLREGVALVLRELMEAEVADQAGAERYERAEERAAYRNGYRPRRLNTRVGTLELAIPKLRSGPATCRASWSRASAPSRPCCPW